LKVKRLVVVSDEIAFDSGKQQLLRLSTPHGMELLIDSVESIIRDMESEDFSDSLLLFQSVQDCIKCVDLGFAVKRLMIARIPSDIGKIKVGHNVFMGEEDVIAIEQLIKQKVCVILQDVPDRPPVNLTDRLVKIKALIATIQNKENI
ncbi:MAG: PTS sugar transporter subunit IIB, partial [Lacticaseibacillus paracasei]